ncbi:hypothetical protein TNCV_3753091 [Trichonephila clavipes]|nr:hypothetical protein TNCV_3753091 [Trichonephila clavipes]
MLQYTANSETPFPFKLLLSSSPYQREGMKFARARWRHHLSPPPQFMHRTGWGNTLHPSAPVVSAVTAHKTFGPTDLSSSFSVCTRRIFGSIEHRTQVLRSRVQYSHH